MYLYTVKAVDAIRHTEFYQSRGEKYQNLTMDRCNYILHRIIQGNRNESELSSFKPTEINATVLKILLGNDYKTYINLLRDSGVIQTNGNPSSRYSGSFVKLKNSSHTEAHSIRYGLTDEAKRSKILKVGVLSERVEKRINNHRLNRIKALSADKTVHSKIIRSITDVYVQEDALAYLAQEQIKTNKANAIKRGKEYDVDFANDHYNANIEALKMMNKAVRLEEFTEISDFYISTSKTVGRVFHTLASIPRCFLSEMVHRTGEGVSEIDQISAQITYLASDWIKKTHPSAFGLATDALKKAIPTQPLRSDVVAFNSNSKNCLDKSQTGQPIIYNDTLIKRIREEEKRRREEGGLCCPVSQPISDKEKEITTERERLLKSIFNKTFYKDVADACRLVAPEYYQMYQDDYPYFKSKVLGMGLYNLNVPLEKAHIMERILFDMFPNWMGYIRAIKRKHKHKDAYKEASIRAQKAESAIFIYGLFPRLGNDDFAIPRHDSVIVKDSDVERVHRMLKELFLEQHPHLNLTPEQVNNLFRITKLESYEKAV